MGPEAVAALPEERLKWDGRVAAASPPESFLVACDAEGVAAFTWVRPGVDEDLPPGFGEVAALYAHPRAWGSGAGAAVLRAGLEELRAAGMRDVTLWTEERNHRPRRFYERSGWTLDGALRERVWRGSPLRELRYRAPAPA